jgi:hypothetical protein
MPRLDSIAAHERMENDRYTDGSGNGRPHKLPVAAASGIVKSVSGLKHINN